jgi:hypothetical protein
MGRDPLMLYLVIQDERGGIGWLAKRFELTERVP